MQRKYWYLTIPGTIAVMGWATIFVYALRLNTWWAVASVLVITLLAGALNLAAAMPKQKKGVVKKAPTLLPPQPGTH